uniref:Uncharacterized protein n=1 Tax=Meloidogyne enterolobii TaxID=390850 RepID=A0A6V7UR28_MELEN|nr:unnamed protein product [Meloidogyne enterolobii]
MDYPAIDKIASYELVFSMLLQFNVKDYVSSFNENQKQKIKEIIGHSNGIDHFYKRVFYRIFNLGLEFIITKYLDLKKSRI